MLCFSHCARRSLHNKYLLGISAFCLLFICAQVIQLQRNPIVSTPSFSPFCYTFFPHPHTFPTDNTNGANGTKNTLYNNYNNDLRLSPPAIRWSQGRLDNQRMLKIYEWTWTGSLWDELMNRFDVCLATQGSISRIPSIGEVAEKWLGPISMAVYLRKPEEWPILNMFSIYMQRCSELFAQTVSIQVAVPWNFDPALMYSDDNDSSRFDFTPWEDYPCGQPHQFLNAIVEKLLPDGIDQGALFPQNHMRNIARKTCGTKWVFMTDIDIIPRWNSSLLLQEFYDSPSSKCTKCAFVIPVYELDSAVKFPETKRQLIDYSRTRLARQFHVAVYREGHHSTNYTMWENTNLEDGPVQVSHDIFDVVRPHYEPFYVSSDVIPPHDERFIGYGFTRSSQVFEARVNGWKFHVLTPMFAIHWGLQTLKSLKKPSGKLVHRQEKLKGRTYTKFTDPRRSENYYNSLLFNEFVAELKAKQNISMSRRRYSRNRGSSTG